MHLTLLLPTLLFLAPAAVLSAPLPSSLNCDSLLSFDEASQHSIVSIRSFCNRRKHKSLVHKRSVAAEEVTSVFDLPSVRSAQQQQAKDHPHLHAVPHYISESDETTDAASKVDSSTSPTSTSFPEEAFTLYAFAPQTSNLPNLQQTAQTLARLHSSTCASIRRQTSNLFTTILGMTSSLIIAGMVAVSFVVLVLLACERWLGAVLRWSRIVSTPSSLSSYPIDEKIPFILITEVDSKPNV